MATTEQVLFIATSIITLGAALVVVTNRNLFHAALAMMLSFLGVAGIYITLDAGFLAAAQLLVYIGAISILIIFAIMLTRRMMQAHESPFNAQRGAGLVTAVFSFGVILFTIWQFWGNNPAFAQKPDLPDGTWGQFGGLESATTVLGYLFVDPNGFVIPFLVSSMLLLAALIGSIYIAWPQVEDEA